MSILLNGLIKNYDPPGGIDSVTDIHFDPTAQTPTWNGTVLAPCPQGDSFNWVPMDGSPWDTGFQPRATGDGFYATIRRTSDGKVYSTNGRVTGRSGTVEPLLANIDSSLYHTNALMDGTLRWRKPQTSLGSGPYQGARLSSHTYTTGDLVTASGRVLLAVAAFGATASSAPAGIATGQYGGTVSDGSVIWQIYGPYGGAWTANTVYTGIGTTSSHTAPGPLFVSTTEGVLWVWDGVTGTWGKLKNEPAWGTATDTQSYWVSDPTDEECGILWVRGSDLYGQAKSGGNERLIVTSLKAPATNGFQVTIHNDGTSTPASSLYQDVVLADRNAREPQTGVDYESRGSDAEGAAGNTFDFGGTDIRIEAGSSATLVYSTSAGTWSQLVTSITLSPGHVASPAAVRGADLTASGAAPLAAGHVASPAAVRGADTSSTGSAPLMAGKIAGPATVRGAATTGTGSVTLGVGKVATSIAVRGAGLLGNTFNVDVGKVPSSAAVRGATLTAAGHATLSPGHVPSGATVRGVTLAGAGTATVAVGHVVSAVIIRGVGLARGGGIGTVTLSDAPTGRVVLSHEGSDGIVLSVTPTT